MWTGIEDQAEANARAVVGALLLLGFEPPPKMDNLWWLTVAGNKLQVLATGYYEPKTKRRVPYWRIFYRNDISGMYLEYATLLPAVVKIIRDNTP